MGVFGSGPPALDSCVVAESSGEDVLFACGAHASGDQVGLQVGQCGGLSVVVDAGDDDVAAQDWDVAGGESCCGEEDFGGGGVGVREGAVGVSGEPEGEAVLGGAGFDLGVSDEFGDAVWGVEVDEEQLAGVAGVGGSEQCHGVQRLVGHVAAASRRIGTDGASTVSLYSRITAMNWVAYWQ